MIKFGKHLLAIIHQKLYILRSRKDNAKLVLLRGTMVLFMMLSSYFVLSFVFPYPRGEYIPTKVDNVTPYFECTEKAYPSWMLKAKKLFFESLDYKEEQRHVQAFFRGYQLSCLRENPFGYQYYVLVDNQNRPYYIFVNENGTIREIHYFLEGFPTHEEINSMADLNVCSTKIYDMMQLERNFLEMYSVMTTDGVYLIEYQKDILISSYTSDADVAAFPDECPNRGDVYILPQDRWFE